MDKMKLVELKCIKKDHPVFVVGDTIKVMTRIPEGDKIRLHPFEGIVIARKEAGARTAFTMRKISYGEGIERNFPLYSPAIERIEVIKKGKVRRAKIFYLRSRIGKRATKVETRED
ncbi:MAG: 50S ribosomal protein L19 [Candidatus Omnitrophota bacterium]|nr:50S ribosomal protein L19 [Candidatus Omnitrophota bacterium]